jgi:hypothetical protein
MGLFASVFFYFTHNYVQLVESGLLLSDGSRS